MKYEKYRVSPKAKIDLNNYDSQRYQSLLTAKNPRQRTCSKNSNMNEAPQEQLYAEGKKHKLLVIIQAMDTGGKDGTIRAVFEGVNPARGQGGLLQNPNASGASA